MQPSRKSKASEYRDERRRSARDAILFILVDAGAVIYVLDCVALEFLKRFALFGLSASK